MNTKMLKKALNDLAQRLVEEYSIDNKDVRDAAECCAILAQVVDGKPIVRAFGAPGDFGYENPIGRALAASESTGTRVVTSGSEYSGVMAADGSIHSDADPGL